MTDALAYPEPPGEADLAPVLAAAPAQQVAERNAAVVDPEIPPRARLLTGARLVAGNQGADRAPYVEWQQDRSQPTPPRAGIDVRQAKILAAPDNLERGLALGSEPAATWLEATRVEPIDVARFDRAPKSGRAGELWDKMIAGRLEGDDEAFALAEKVMSAGEVLEDFDDDLSLGNGTVVDINERVRVHWDSEPAPGVVTALPLDSLPLDAFDGDTDTGFDTLVGDDIVVAAPVESQATLRRAFPAATYGEGTPRWLNVQPATVAGLLRAVDSAGIDPAANVSVHLSGHPGLAPYDSVTFTAPADKRADRFRALGAERLGRGLVAVPRYKRRAVAAEELVDAPTVDKLVEDTAWAIFDEPVEGAIPVRTADGGEAHMLFGIGPDEAAELATTFAYTNDGIAIESGYDGLEPYSDEPRWFELDLGDGDTYRFPVSQDEAMLYPDRTQRPVDRWQIPNPDRAHLGGLAAHLEMLDAEDVAAYVTGHPGEGFLEAREVLWGDGYGNVASSRVAGTRSGANVIPVWLRRNDGLPADNDINPNLLDTAGAEAGAQQVGSKWRVDASGTLDVASAVRQGHTLGMRYGYDNVEVVTDRGKLRLVR